MADAGDLRLAGHLPELAVQADPASARAQEVQAEVYGRRAAAEASTMAQGVFRWTASQAAAFTAPD